MTGYRTWSWPADHHPNVYRPRMYEINPSERPGLGVRMTRYKAHEEPASGRSGIGTREMEPIRAPQPPLMRSPRASSVPENSVAGRGLEPVVPGSRRSRCTVKCAPFIIRSSTVTGAVSQAGSHRANRRARPEPWRRMGSTRPEPYNSCHAGNSSRATSFKWNLRNKFLNNDQDGPR
jgi:hypothetical protein